MRNVEMILENIVDNTKMQMLEENAQYGNVHSELDILRTKKLVQESTNNLREILRNGGMQEIHENIAVGVEPALRLARRLEQLNSN